MHVQKEEGSLAKADQGTSPPFFSLLLLLGETQISADAAQNVLTDKKTTIMSSTAKRVLRISFPSFNPLPDRLKEKTRVRSQAQH